MADIYSTISSKATPQTEKADPRQKKNNAGGYTFTVSDLDRAKRFLVLGSEGGSFYVKERELTLDNAKVIQRMAVTDHKALVDLIVDVSTRGLAHRQQPGLFALAIAASVENTEDRKYALAQLSKVARTGTTLFTFVGYVQQFRGWSRGLRTAFSNWYLEKTPEQVAFQAVKYRQRGGYTHRDILRQAHPKTDSEGHKDVFNWITKGLQTENTPAIIRDFEDVQAGSPVLEVLGRGHGLPWEALPDEHMNDPKVWEHLVDSVMPLGALIRQLPRLTRLGVLKPLDARTGKVAARLQDTAELKKARIHPMQMLVANRTYTKGVGRGGRDWVPVQAISDALDAGFYAAFGAVEPTGKNTMIAVDVSGSMTWGAAGETGLMSSEVATAMALVIANTEPNHYIMGFGRQFTPLPVSPSMTLNEALKVTSGLPFSGTDCAVAFNYARQKSLDVDTFVVITDNETWAGRSHPHQALKEYRRKMNKPQARSVVLATTSSEFSIADPSDPLMLDIAGFSADVPQVISAFSRGA